MTLFFFDGQSFVTNSVPYSYRPATAGETMPRIIIEVEIEGIRTQAAVDTGGVYLFCNPSVARHLHLDETGSLGGVKEILFRGVWVRGKIYRLALTILAEIGNGHNLQTTAFVPEEGYEGEIPCILGLHGCLERLRFAVDPHTDTFYFGA